MTPYFSDPDLTLYRGDATEVLRSLPAGSVHMACTSPPFFGLRDYQSEGQIGLESSPDEWAARLVDVFREVRRVLRDDGTLWVECGDSYCNAEARKPYGDQDPHGRRAAELDMGFKRREQPPGTKPKDLLGQPWLLAFALRADGWYLRSCIIWSKPNAMPESVTDRPTTAHSYLFLFSKKSRYFYDAEALREPASYWGGDRPDPKQVNGGYGVKSMGGRADPVDGQKNARTVWTIPTEPNALAICRVCDAYWQGGAPREHCGESVVQHFAAFPRELVRRMILAGTSERGVCAECGAPWVREVEQTPISTPMYSEARGYTLNGAKDTITRLGDGVRTQTLGWNASCKCATAVVPALVCDPFSGSGTTLLVARQLGRYAIGVELNERYAAMTKARLAQQSLFADVPA